MVVDEPVAFPSDGLHLLYPEKTMHMSTSAGSCSWVYLPDSQFLLYWHCLCPEAEAEKVPRQQIMYFYELHNVQKPGNFYLKFLELGEVPCCCFCYSVEVSDICNADLWHCCTNVAAKGLYLFCDSVSSVRLGLFFQFFFLEATLDTLDSPSPPFSYTHTHRHTYNRAVIWEHFTVKEMICKLLLRSLCGLQSSGFRERNLKIQDKPLNCSRKGDTQLSELLTHCWICHTEFKVYDACFLVISHKGTFVWYSFTWQHLKKK